VIAQAAQRGLGHLGWSWSGNGGGGTGLDMTNNFDPASLTNWGSRIINGTNGIRASSVRATVFGAPGTGRTFAADEWQWDRPSRVGDTFTVTGTAGGATFSVQGAF
jgi:hypothetical protein